MKNKVQIWVDPDFRKMLKKRAFDQETDVLELTKNLAKGNFEDTVFEPLTKHFKRIL